MIEEIEQDMKSLRLQQFPSRGAELWWSQASSCLAGSPSQPVPTCCTSRRAERSRPPASIEGNHVVIELPEGKYEFLREDFRKLVPGFTPQREWDARRQEAQSAGFTARYEAVWWAIENGLASEAAAELRASHGTTRTHAPTARMVAALDKLDGRATDPELLRVPQGPGNLDQHRSGPHVVLLHQPGRRHEAEERVALLERVITGYYLLFAAQGIELSVPTRRLIFAWFADQKDYLAFLHSQNADAFATTRGYYHPTWNAVVAYDAPSSDRQQSGQETASARREELRQFQTTVDRLPARARLRVTLTGESARTLGRADALALIDRLEREVRREELLLDLERRAINDGTATHEMIHLLAANSGLLPRHDAFPIWLQEGLAMQFEVIRGGRWAGIGRVHDLRLPDWRRIQPPPPLEPLVRDTGYGRGYQRDLYAQAWSLVYYLRAQHPEQFLTFLDLLRSPDAALAELSPGRSLLSTAFQPRLRHRSRGPRARLARVHVHAPDAPGAPRPDPGPQHLLRLRTRSDSNRRRRSRSHQELMELTESPPIVNNLTLHADGA